MNTKTFGCKGLGKGYGLGKVGMPRRYKTRLEKNISKGSIRRLARRGGVVRMDTGVYDTVRKELRSYLTKVIRKTIIYAENDKRKTIFARDVVYALKYGGVNLYGFGG
jgi:histone H4